MSNESVPVRWGPNGPVVGGEFIVVREEGPIKWGHNGNGVVDLFEFDDEKLTAEFRQFDKDRHFLEAHQSEWLEQYPDMYVAVYGEELVAVASSRKELAEQIRARDIRSGTAYTRYLTTKKVIMVPYTIYCSRLTWGFLGITGQREAERQGRMCEGIYFSHV